MRELENERIRKLANEMEATRNASEKIVSLFNFAKGASRTGSVSYTGREKISKLENEKISKLESWGVRKITKKNERIMKRILMKKGCKEGGVSL